MRTRGMRRHVLAPLVTASVLGLTLLPAAQAQNRTLMSAEHAGAKATVMIIDGAATLRLESAGSAPRTISLGADWKRVSNVRFSPNGSRLAIVADAATPQLALVDVPTARVLATYATIAAAVAPDGRAVIVEHRPDVSSPTKTPMSLIPLNAAGDALLADDKGYPVSIRQSDFVWTDPEVVAFIRMTDGSIRVVALQVGQPGLVEKHQEKLLPVSEFADPAAVKDAPSLARAIKGVEITRVPSAGLILRLQFPANQGVVRRTVDVRMWE